MAARRVNPITQFCKQNELSSLHEDLCYIDRRDHDSRKPFRWVTYNYHPYGSNPRATCYPGQLYDDGHVPGAAIDEESKVKIHPGFEMTNPNVHQELPMLPVNMPRIRGYFDSDTESGLRWEPTFNKKQCTRTSEKSFVPYRFQIFDHLCYDPQDPQYIIPELTYNGCYPTARFYHWGGEDSRNDRLTKFQNGCDYKAKYFPPNLSYSNWGY